LTSKYKGFILVKSRPSFTLLFQWYELLYVYDVAPGI